MVIMLNNNLGYAFEIVGVVWFCYFLYFKIYVTFSTDLIHGIQRMFETTIFQKSAV